ncbi:MAG: hypothetical protein Q8P25_00785 [Candidatus Curtissbacteria bacterium]|nr:hypothetical protein [Candidatus Curtissbacteria bacterium]
MNAVQFKKIKTTLDFVLKSKISDFYRKKYSDEKLRLNSPQDFLNIPFLTRDEIAKSPPTARLFVPQEEVKTWITTSGTTSKEPLIIPASPLKQDYLQVLAQNLKKYSVKRIMLLKPSGYANLRILDWNSHPKLSGYPLIFGDLRQLETTASLAKLLKIDALETTPTALHFFIPYLKEIYPLSNIKYIILGGEYTSDQKYKFFKTYLKNAYFDFTFGGTETRGKKGLRCDYLNRTREPRFFHPISNLFHFEVTGEGELILTTLFKTPFPLIRYKTGDMVSITKNSCPCGRKEQMEVFGRVGYDSVRIGGITVHRHLVEVALPKFNGDWEMHLFEEVNNKRLMPKLVLHLSKTSKKEAALIAERVQRNLKVGPNLYLKKLVDDEIFLPLKIELVNSFEEKYKRAKLVSHIK